jgi:hypothetical protein
MATGFPTKSNWAAGDVLTAAQMDDLAGTVNLLSPVGVTSGYVLSANGSANSYTWAAVPSAYLGYSAKTTAYTTVLGDVNYVLSMNNATSQAFSIPTNASVAYPIGTQINFVWITGAGQPTIQAVTSGTTTILSTGAVPATPKLRVVNSMASAIKIATDTWIVTGDIA